jgi:uncharacterized protein YnzC (UPF0291/DUF896 family)
MDIVEPAYISPATKKTLQQFGWKDGEPIPDTLGGLMLQLKETLPPSSNVDVLVDVAVMQADDVEKIKTLLQEAKDLKVKKDKKAEQEKFEQNMTESVREAYRKFASPEVVDDRGAEVIDDRTAPETEPAPESAPSPAAPAVEIEDELNRPSETGYDAPSIIFPFCPRCGWDMKQKYDVKVTDNDKEDFLVTLLGGSRFRREYEIAGGRMKIVFRSMLADENFLVQRQLLLDQNNNEIFSEAEWFLRLAEYRMACSLEAVADSTGKLIYANPELQDFKFTPPADKPTQTPLVLARQQVNAKPLAHEVTRRLIAAQLRQFQRLVEALEAMALEPSFWNGIE